MIQVTKLYPVVPSQKGKNITRTRTSCLQIQGLGLTCRYVRLSLKACFAWASSFQPTRRQTNRVGRRLLGQRAFSAGKKSFQRYFKRRRRKFKVTGYLLQRTEYSCSRWGETPQQQLGSWYSPLDTCGRTLNC